MHALDNLIVIVVIIVITQILESIEREEAADLV